MCHFSGILRSPSIPSFHSTARINQGSRNYPILLLSLSLCKPAFPSSLSCVSVRHELSPGRTTSTARRGGGLRLRHLRHATTRSTEELLIVRRLDRLNLNNIFMNEWTRHKSRREYYGDRCVRPVGTRGHVETRTQHEILAG